MGLGSLVGELVAELGVVGEQVPLLKTRGEGGAAIRGAGAGPAAVAAPAVVARVAAGRRRAVRATSAIATRRGHERGRAEAPPASPACEGHQPRFSRPNPPRRATSTPSAPSSTMPRMIGRAGPIPPESEPPTVLPSSSPMPPPPSRRSRVVAGARRAAGAGFEPAPAEGRAGAAGRLADGACRGARGGRSRSRPARPRRRRRPASSDGPWGRRRTASRRPIRWTHRSRRRWSAAAAGDGCPPPPRWSGSVTAGTRDVLLVLAEARVVLRRSADGNRCPDEEREQR